MVIAIDLDGCVYDTEEYYRTYAHFWDLAVVGNGLQKSDEMHMDKRFGWDKETINNFYDKFTAEIVENAPLKVGAKYVLDQLKQRGHKLVCVTLRGYYQDCEIPITEKRFEAEGISFDKIVYNQTNKLQACLDENVDLIVDDNPDNVEMLAKNNIKCLHFRGIGMKNVEHENVTEVQNWADVLEKINKLEK